MENYTLKKPSSHKSRKRVGRGPSSGMGKTSTRGQKGQMSRSGARRRAWFEGGQMPLVRRVPKRGFNNIFKTAFQLVNLDQLEKISKDDITPEILKEAGLIKKVYEPVKILANGEISKSLKITADAFSKSAEDKIVKAGGSIIVRKKSELNKKKKVS